MGPGIKPEDLPYTRYFGKVPGEVQRRSDLCRSEMFALGLTYKLFKSSTEA